MKLLNPVSLFFALFALSGGMVLADHGDPQTRIQRLQSESQTLNEVVNYSYINWRVKSEVRQFAQSVIALNFCETRGGGNGRGGRNIVQPMDHGDNVPNCVLQMRSLQYTFRIVERRLYDTNYDFPQIYRQYLETSEAYYDFMRERGMNP